MAPRADGNAGKSISGTDPLVQTGYHVFMGKHTVLDHVALEFLFQDFIDYAVLYWPRSLLEICGIVFRDMSLEGKSNLPIYESDAKMVAKSELFSPTAEFLQRCEVCATQFVTEAFVADVIPQVKK